MLPKYANLENESNNFIFASKQLQNFRNIDTSGKDTILKSESSTTSSGIAPKNELEEFNSNLTEITTYIAQLKTYVKDSLNKGFVTARDRQQFAERPPRDDLNADAEQEYNIQNKKAFEKIVDKEANNIGKLPPLKQISLFQESSDTEMSGSGRLCGGGVDEREILEEEIDKLSGVLVKLEQASALFPELYREYKIEKDDGKKEALNEGLIELFQLSQKTFFNFPADLEIDSITEYFKDNIKLNLEEMKRLKEEIKQDYLSEKETMKPVENETIGELEKAIEDVKQMSINAGAESPEDIVNFKAIRDTYGLHGNAKYKLVIETLEKQRRSLLKTRKAENVKYKQTFASELVDTEEDIDKFEEMKTEKLEKIQERYADIMDELAKYDERIAESKALQAELEEQTARAMAAGKQKKAVRDAEEAYRLQVKLEALQAEAEALRAEADALALQQLKDTADINKLREVKGVLTAISPNVNPIISTLTKLISLITKENVLFNGKIKKNINSLDRLDVEDLINKLNKVIINLQSIPNQSYISVSIENGYEMLKQLYDSLNKLSADVGNGVYSYTSKLRGGSRHYNDHYQYYSRMTVNDNPHIYKYMM